MLIRLEPSTIPYSANQPVDPQLWDDSIYLFRINEYLEGDVKNIACSLYRMAIFIRQRKLKDKTTKDIPQIVEFRFTAWDFILSIYEFGWNKLNANKNSNSFRQCVALQSKL